MGIKTDYELVTILAAIITSKQVLFLGVDLNSSERNSNIYAISVNDKQIKVVVASNGYIVTAYPTTQIPTIDDEKPSPWMHI